MTVRLFSFLIAFLISLAAIGQVYDPVKWSFDYKLDGDEHAILNFTADIEEHWHVYATKLESDMGPIPTEIVFAEIDGATLDGQLIEPTPKKEYDPNFDMELSWFEGTVTLSQRVKLTSPMARITGELTYMTCDDTKCLPPEYLDFQFDIEAAIKPGSQPIEPAEGLAPESDVDATSDESAVYNPVSWRFETAKKDGSTLTLKAIASIDEHWHVYS
ncbi:MAG: protein-disulfide reductase DsbD domain-containing protein, partial [Salibacteraceae bacterium]